MINNVQAQYPGYNLAMVDIVIPESKEICTPNDISISVILANLGERDYDFSIDTIGIGYEVISPKGIISGYLSIRSGGLLSEAMDSITLISGFPIIDAGNYVITAYVISPIDNFCCDDTITRTYYFGMIGLPFDENFSGVNMPDELVSMYLYGVNKWEVYHPVVNDPVQPNSGTGMLRFAGTFGEGAKLTTRQIDLYGTSNPTLKFWYYHDSTSSGTDASNTKVYIVADEVASQELSVRKGNNIHGWKQYTVDLSAYTTAKCVFIEFESLNMSEQYIDRILIFSCDIPVTNYFATICEGAFYTDSNFTNLTQAGIYYDTLQNINGCDSVIELTLTVNSVYFTQISDSISAGNSYDFHGKQLTTGGIHYDTLQTIFGCDSIFELTLTVTSVGIAETHCNASVPRVYPNPAGEQLRIKNYELREDAEYTIYSVVGQVVMEGVLPCRDALQCVSTIDVQHLTNGMYFLKIDGKTVKFVKE